LENPTVQTILKRMTGMDFNKIFKPRKESLQNPIYKVMDREEFEEVEQGNMEEALKRLEMPEVMTKRKPIEFVHSKDSLLKDHDEDDADYVFTDISTSKNMRDRAVLVRENSTGILREASWDERDRMQYMYWPKEGQQHRIVEMLMDEHLPRSFEQLRHNDVLDLINIQCEPDSPDYIRVHQRVYEDLDRQQQYNVLHSTRHFAGMVYHYVSKENATKFFSYLLRSDRLEDAVDLLNLDLMVNPESEFAVQAKDLQNVDLAKSYITFHGLHELKELLDEPTKHEETGI